MTELKKWTNGIIREMPEHKEEILYLYKICLEDIAEGEDPDMAIQLFKDTIMDRFE